MAMSPPALMWALSATEASLVFVWWVTEWARPTATNPPAPLSVVAAVAVVDWVLMVKLPPAATDCAETLAFTVGFSVTVEVLSLTPTNPPPEPWECAVETPSPGGGTGC